MNELKISVDEITLKNITCNETDHELLNKLHNNDTVIYYEDYHTIIKDNDFYLESHTNWISGTKFYFTKLTIKRTDDIKSLTSTELDKMITQIKDRLWSIYRIELTLTGGIIDSMVIIKTIPLTFDYSDYVYMLKYGCELLYAEYNQNGYQSRCYSSDGIVCFKSDDIDITYYGKRVETLDETILNTDYNVLCVEYLIKNSKAVGRELNDDETLWYTDFVKFKTDADIERWFKTRWYKDMCGLLIDKYSEQLISVTGYFRWLKSNRTYSIGSIFAHVNTLLGTHNMTDKLIDGNIITLACKRLDRNYKRTLRNMHHDKWECTGTMGNLLELMTKIDYSDCENSIKFKFEELEKIVKKHLNIKNIFGNCE